MDNDKDLAEELGLQGEAADLFSAPIGQTDGQAGAFMKDIQ